MKKHHIQLTATDRAYFEKLLSKGNLKAKVYRRALGLLELDRGKTYTTVCATIQVTIPTLSGWASDYKENGLEVLEDQPRSGRPTKIDGSAYKGVVFKVLHTPPSSYRINRTTWRIVDIQSVMDKQRLHLSTSSISKIIRNEGYRFKKAKIVLTNNDPDYVEKVERIKKILSHLGAKEKSFSIDEYGPVQSNYMEADRLMPPGITKTVPQFQKSKGSLIVTGALELSTNQMTHFFSDKKDTEEMLRLLEILLVKYKDEDCIYLSWTQLHGTARKNSKTW